MTHWSSYSWDSLKQMVAQLIQTRKSPGEQQVENLKAKGLWQVRILNPPYRQLQSRLDETQAAHVLEICKERLDRFDNPIESSDLDLTKLPNFCNLYLLKDQGGPLRRQKIQIGFAAVPKIREVIILQIYLGWGPIPGYEVSRLADNLIDYLRFGNTLNWQSSMM
jgi:hypothetical protein